MKKNHRKDQNMWSSHITTNNKWTAGNGMNYSCRCQQFIFLTPDWLFSCNTITYSCRYNKGCFGHWTLGRYCLEITQANHCIVLYVQYPIANSCNARSNLYWISYISRSISDVHRFEKTGDILQCQHWFSLEMSWRDATWICVVLQIIWSKFLTQQTNYWSAVSEIYFNQSKALHHISFRSTHLLK